MNILSETNIDLSEIPTAEHFTSSLRLSPNNKVSEE